MFDLTKNQKRALREAAALAHQRDRSMGLEDRDVFYLEAGSADLPLIIAGVVNRGILSIDDVGEAARDLVADIAARLREVVRESGNTRRVAVEDPYDPAAPVSVSRILDEMEFLGEGTALFLNGQTGEVTVRAVGDWLDADDADVPDEEPSVDEDPAWVRLLSHAEVDDLETMRRFAFRAVGPAASKELSEALHGRGLYRRFRDVIHRRGLEREWDAYRAEKRAALVRSELQQHGIAFRR